MADKGKDKTRTGKFEVIDKNGNRRAYCDNQAAGKKEIERLGESKPAFRPFEVRKVSE